MAPHAMETILQPPQWPLAFSSFVSWCLMWDPKNRPTSKQALEHEFFADAVDPLRPKSSSRLLGRKHSDLSFMSKDSGEIPISNSKPSWFRRSLIARDSAPVVSQQETAIRPAVHHQHTDSEISTTKIRPHANKRATWANGAAPVVGAPMAILPSIKPVSPVPNVVTAQASSRLPVHEQHRPEQRQLKSDRFAKLGRQLSVNSHMNQYFDTHRQEAERALNGDGSSSGLISPPYQKEGFFSHLRKKARRFSGRHGLVSPNADDVEATAAAAVPWSNRSSMMVDSVIPGAEDFTELDKALANVRYSLDRAIATPEERHTAMKSTTSPLKRTHSVQNGSKTRSSENLNHTASPVGARTRRALQMSTNSVSRYETPEEADELLHEAMNPVQQATRPAEPLPRYTHRAAALQRDQNRVSMPQLRTNNTHSSVQQYPTPSPSGKREGVFFGHDLVTVQPLNITQPKAEHEHAPNYWPTPPNEEPINWARAAAASAYASQPIYR